MLRVLGYTRSRLDRRRTTGGGSTWFAVSSRNVGDEVSATPALPGVTVVAVMISESGSTAA